MGKGTNAPQQIFAQIQLLRSQLSELERKLPVRGSDQSEPVVDIAQAIPQPNMAQAAMGIFHCIITPVWVFNRNCEVVYLNPAAARFVNSLPSELIGRPLAEIVNSSIADEYALRVRNVIDFEIMESHEDRMDLQDGVRWLSSVMGPWREVGQQVRYAVLTWHDVTARKLAEATLRSQMRFDQIVAEISTAFANEPHSRRNEVTHRVLKLVGEYLDLDRGVVVQFPADYSSLSCIHEWRKDGQGTFVTRTLERPRQIATWFFDQLTGGQPIRFAHVDELPDEPSGTKDFFIASDVGALIAVPLFTNGRVTGALCFDGQARKDGWTRETEMRVCVVGNLISTAHERWRIEHALSEEQRFVSAVLAASPLITYVFDIQTHETVFFSRHFHASLGYSPQWIEDHKSNLLEAVLRPEFVAQLPTLLKRWDTATDTDVIETEYWALHANGTWRLFLGRDVVFRRDEGGRVRQIIGTTQDITERRKNETELDEHRRQLLHGLRLRHLGETVAGVAHEIGHPVYSIINFTTAAKNVVRRNSDPEFREAVEWLDQAVDAARRAGDIIHRLRSFARRDTGTNVVTRPSEIIRTAVDFVAFEANRRETRIRTTCDADADSDIQIDEVLMQQVFVNLLQNAMEAVADEPVEMREIIVSVRGEGAVVAICVSDRGAGIKLPVEKIFEPFVTDKPNGLGLGLTISRTIVEEQGGTLSCEPNRENGTTFIVRIPRYERLAAS